MGQAPKHLISIGDAWVDPRQVAAVDDAVEDGDPSWSNVRVILSSGQIVFGRRSPARVVQAVRHPEREVTANEPTEAFPEPQQGAQRRARRRSGRTGGPRPIWADADQGHGDH